MLINFFQHFFRFDGSVDFHRSWEDYKNGFGDPNGEYWLGNEALHLLTKEGGPFEVYLHGRAFDNGYQGSR